MPSLQAASAAPAAPMQTGVCDLRISSTQTRRMCKTTPRQTRSWHHLQDATSWREARYVGRGPDVTGLVGMQLHRAEQQRTPAHASQRMSSQHTHAHALQRLALRCVLPCHLSYAQYTVAPPPGINSLLALPTLSQSELSQTSSWDG